MLKNISYQKEETSKTGDIADKSSFKMRKYAIFVEMNVILMTITKAQLLWFVGS